MISWSSASAKSATSLVVSRSRKEAQCLESTDAGSGLEAVSK